MTAGQAFKTIRDGRLYKASPHDTFDAYCRERWQLSKPYVTQLVCASVVVECLVATATILPKNESVARPLTELEPLIAARSRQGERTDLSPNSGKGALDTHREVAKVAGVGHDTIARSKHIRDHATEEVKEQLRDPNGGISINRAYQDLKTEDRRQERTLSET